MQEGRKHTCMASYMPMPAVTEPPGELMKSLMSCSHGLAVRAAIGAWLQHQTCMHTLPGSVASSMSSWLTTASATKSLTYIAAYVSTGRCT